MELRDKFEVGEGLSMVGKIKVEHSNGKTYFRNNIITRSGREMLFGLFREALGGSSDENTYRYDYLRITYGYSDNIPTADDDEKYIIDDNIISLNSDARRYDTGLLALKLSFAIEGDKDVVTFNKYNYIGIVMTRYDDNNDTDDKDLLISRVMLDGMPLGPNDDINIEYTLYF